MKCKYYNPINSNFSQNITKILDIKYNSQLYPLLLLTIILKNEKIVKLKCLLSYLRRNEIH